MIHYDTVKRIWRKEGGVTFYIVIRRLKCTCCGSIHRELPDILSPYKHYETDVIEGVVEGIVTSSDIESEDYPCENTMERWIDWINRNRNNINGFLKSVGYRLLDFGMQLLESRISLLDKLIELRTDWLKKVNLIFYNLGERLTP